MKDVPRTSIGEGENRPSKKSSPDDKNVAENVVGGDDSGAPPQSTTICADVRARVAVHLMTLVRKER